MAKNKINLLRTSCQTARYYLFHKNCNSGNNSIVLFYVRLLAVYTPIRFYVMSLIWCRNVLCHSRSNLYIKHVLNFKWCIMFFDRKTFSQNHLFAWRKSELKMLWRNVHRGIAFIDTSATLNCKFKLVTVYVF